MPRLTMGGQSDEIDKRMANSGRALLARDRPFGHCVRGFFYRRRQSRGLADRVKDR